MKKFRLSTDSLEAFACILITIPLVSYVLAVVTLWLGFPINGFIFPVSVCLVLGWEWMCKSHNQVSWKGIVAVLLILAITLLLSSAIYDISFDGPWYHSGTILHLAEGWNPYYQSVSGIDDYYTSLWTEHYARGIEMLASVVVSCVGNLEAGKAVNLWFVIASVVYIYIFLRYTLPNTNRYLRVWLTLVVALNPVVVNQMLTYYTDWSLYTILLISVINLYLFFIQKKRWALGMELLLLFFVPAIKFNIFFWICLWSAVAFFGLLIKSRYRHPYRLIAMIAGVLLAGAVIGAYNPYITNWSEHGTPLYPLAGEGAVDIMSDNTPLYLKDKSRIEAVVLSLMAAPVDGDAVDCRIGGFGTFFFKSMFLVCLLFICAKRTRRMWGLLAVTIGLFLSLFILPSGWWARYVAFFKIFPLVLMFYVIREDFKWWWQRAWLMFILALLSWDVKICGDRNVEKNIAYRHQMECVLDALEKQGREIEINTWNYAFLNQMKKRGIPYRQVDNEYEDVLPLSFPAYVDGLHVDCKCK